MKLSSQLPMLIFFCQLLCSTGFAQKWAKKLDYLKQVKCVIIADIAHASGSFLKEQVEILKSIKTADSEFECLFLEIEPKASVAINHFLTGIEYEKSVRLWISDSSHRVGVPFQNIIPEWYINEVNHLGFKIIGVDVDWASKIGEKIIPLVRLHNQGVSISEIGNLLVGERSKIIAENVVQSLENNSCRKGVLVVGSGHLEDFMFKPVQLYFKDANVTGFIW